MNLILLEPEEAGNPLPRRDERTIHLLKVLHKQVGDTFEVGILGGALGQGRIEAIRRDGSLIISMDLKETAPPRTPIRMVIGFSRPIQLKHIVRDLSSLGIAWIDLIGTDLSEKSYQDARLLTDGSARAAMIQGAIQGRDTELPILEAYASLDTWLMEQPWDRDNHNPQGRSSWVNRPLLIATDNVRAEGAFAHLGAGAKTMVVAVGAERGWSDRERDLFFAAGFTRLSMGRRAMRTETASLAAAILAMEKIGELG